MIEDKYLTRKQVQRMLKLSREEMRRLIISKRLKAYSINSHIVFKYEDVDRFMVTVGKERSSDKPKYR